MRVWNLMIFRCLILGSYSIIVVNPNNRLKCYHYWEKAYRWGTLLAGTDRYMPPLFRLDSGGYKRGLTTGVGTEEG